MTGSVLPHSKVLDHFRTQWERGNLPSCWIWTGPSGIGKKKTALFLSIEIFQKTLSMLPPRSIQKQIEQDGFPNLLKIEPDDSHSDITIHQTRRILDFLQSTSSFPGWRIVLIDQAHRMNHFASNQLLKTLEEPPAQTLLILITPFYSKILPTLRSRCCLFRFSPPSQEDLATLFHHQVDSIDSSILPYCQGKADQYHFIKNQGGLDWINRLNKWIDQIEQGSFQSIKEWADHLAPQKDQIEFISIFILYLIEKRLANTPDLLTQKKWADCLTRGNQFLIDALGAHLDPTAFWIAFWVSLKGEEKG